MSTVLRQAGDRLLGLFLPQAAAGACVPSQGDRCSCYCVVQGGEGKICYWKTKNCYGTCVATSILC
jgi:hypothetical protein